ncbi:NAD(P)-dependent dehydrogenase (short-subunit alcohol dehydrogenase family) [Saccharomonospora amisosensis]|uniref:NAD(P)-dependent dehydrogenase (Short-subunit alcohol dehydrogenase family) n=1 Tax=Saccharomonospora amisosensis TaxID=1128677 RepID=A0A7X5ZR40_9PSEU|nr:SDR family oxidoreductase [Saccharomonospora amisosensis]NIJ12432.1 NAD(P)-dependent dehydrogenase (short-subunit alcohol dehydrogenase family) [Saccharomonospora amisosensis]
MSLTVVTGSASGIGAATRAALLEEGKEVVGVDLRDADITADLSTREGRRGAVDAVLQRCGGTLDGLVLCAGLGPHVDDAERIVAVNYFGTIAMLDGLFPALRKGDDAAAVVVSSVSSTHITWDDNPLASVIESGDEAGVGPALEVGGEYKGQFAYAGSKNALTVAVRRRVAEWGAAGVRLNTVAPGSVETPLLSQGMADARYGQAIREFVAPIPRHAKPEEVATLISYLLSPKAGFVHGSQLVIDGGVDALLRPTRF